MLGDAALSSLRKNKSQRLGAFKTPTLGVFPQAVRRCDSSIVSPRLIFGFSGDCQVVRAGPCELKDQQKGQR